METWLLVLSKDTGILLDSAGEHIMRFAPDGVTLSPRGQHITMADGTKVKVVLGWDAFALWAWLCETEDDFLNPRNCFLRPSKWDLLCWSLTNHRSPEPWLRWSPSYGSRTEGLRALCSDTAALDKAIKKWGASMAAKWMSQARPPEADTLRRRILAIISPEAKLGTYLSGPLIVVGLTMLTYVALAKDTLSEASFVACGMIAIGGLLILIFGIVALFIDLRGRRLAKRLSRPGHSSTT